MLGVESYAGQVIAGAEPPRLGAVTVHDRGRDGQAGPVEVAVIAQFAAAGHDSAGELVERRGRAAFGAYQRRRLGAQLGGGVTEHGGVLADVHDRAGDRQREGHELVQCDVEGNAVARRAG